MNAANVVQLLALAVAVSAMDDREDKFLSYAARFGKNYTLKETPMRMAIYTDRRELIRQHNAEAAAGLHSYTMGENHLADRTLEEIEMTLGTSVEMTRSKLNNGPVLDDRQSPSQVDYRSDVCLPAVENQGSCGSCWAFAAAVPLEWQFCKKNKRPIILSKQQMVSCSSSYGNGGCGGGFYSNGWDYVKAVGGIASASSYPYTGSTGRCTFSASTAVAKVSTWNWVFPYNNENALASAVATYGPVPVAIYVNTNLAYYRSGVFNDPSCPKTTVNHAVVIVGYGTDATNGDFWIIRNSWGASWGVSGYFLMKRGVNMCAINGWGAYPSVA